MYELSDHRRVARGAIKRMNFDPVVFESFGARPESPEASYLSELGSSDIYVGIFGHKYSESVEKEYRYAASLKKDVLIFIREDGSPDPKLLELISEFQRNHTYAKYKTLDELGPLVTKSILDLLVRQYQASVPNEGKAGGKSTQNASKDQLFSSEVLDQLSDLVLIGFDYEDHVVNPNLNQMLSQLGSTGRILFEYSSSQSAHRMGLVDEMRELSEQLNALSRFQFFIGLKSIQEFGKKLSACVDSVVALSAPLKKRLVDFEATGFDDAALSSIDLLRSEWKRHERYVSRGETERLRSTFQVIAFRLFRLGNTPYADRRGLGIILRDLGTKTRNLASSTKYFFGAEPPPTLAGAVQEVLELSDQVVTLIKSQGQLASSDS